MNVLYTCRWDIEVGQLKFYQQELRDPEVSGPHRYWVVCPV